MVEHLLGEASFSWWGMRRRGERREGGGRLVGEVDTEEEGRVWDRVIGAVRWGRGDGRRGGKEKKQGRKQGNKVSEREGGSVSASHPCRDTKREKELTNPLLLLAVEPLHPPPQRTRPDRKEHLTRPPLLESFRSRRRVHGRFEGARRPRSRGGRVLDEGEERGGEPEEWREEVGREGTSRTGFERVADELERERRREVDADRVLRRRFTKSQRAILSPMKKRR